MRMSLALPKERQQLEVKKDLESQLVLYNDDYNTFEYVIDNLIEICNHTLEQAEQCTLLVHYKGKCEVKTGSREDLIPYCEKLLSRGLSAEVE